ncbi:GNAT family N-acetyltransferase [Fluviicola sp.]|uniref:GNAT family N-acetyltransferase n=1 Tax=Fluviicola sp. TaxID=1917219 RepID=UPI0031CF82F7
MMKLPPFDVFPVLQSEKVVLREVSDADIPLLLDVLTYDGKTAETLDEGVAIISKIRRDYQAGNAVNWLIEEAGTGELAGLVGYFRGFENGTGELGCILKAAYRGKGFMFPSLNLTARFGMEEMKLNQVIALTKPENDKAIALLSRNGFQQQEGLTEGYLKFVYLPE